MSVILIRNDAPAKVTAGEQPAYFLGLACFGLSSLAGAAASSLISDFLHSSGPERIGQFLAIVATVGLAGSALLAAFWGLRGQLKQHTRRVAQIASIAAAVHLVTLLYGLWRLPEASRTFDLTVAAMLVIELAIAASIGHQRTRLRLHPEKATGAPSAAAVLLRMFVISVVVAAVAAAGMAASTAGHLAVPHSQHGQHQEGGVPGNIEQLKNSEHHH